jgi:hypothetical protein
VNTEIRRPAPAPGLGGDEAVPVALEDHHRLAEHRQVLGAVTVHIDLAEQLRPAAGDRADEERGRVQALPGGEVVAEQHGDLRVESGHRPACRP